MDFCGIKTTSRFFLAPLAGYTDAGFRALAVENGAALTYTEMVSAKGMCYGSPGTEALLYVTPAEKTVAVQLFGSDPEFMRRHRGHQYGMSGEKNLFERRRQRADEGPRAHRGCGAGDR